MARSGGVTDTAALASEPYVADRFERFQAIDDVLLCLELPAVVYGVTVAPDNRVNKFPHLADHVTKIVALIDVQGDDRLALGILAGDQVRGHLGADVGDLV